MGDIFEQFELSKTLKKLDDADLLYLVTKDVVAIDLHPRQVSNADMGAIFEELIRKFAESSNETAGEHFTPRDAVSLVVDLLLAPDDKVLTKPGIVRHIYDPTAGTGGMLAAGRGAHQGRQRARRGRPGRAGDQRPVLRHLQVRHGDQGLRRRRDRLR